MKSFTKTKSSLLGLLLSAFFLLSSAQISYAQNPPPVIMAQVNAELQRRGLTEAEVRTRLLQEGIDLENIPPAELPQYQARVTAILDAMEAEKKTTVKTPTVIVEPVITEPETTVQEATAEAAQRVVQAAANEEKAPVKIYGHSLFTDQSLDIFRTTDGATAPDTYILGAGDKIRISIFGSSQTDLQLEINDDGYIQPSGMPKIFLQGLSLKQAKELMFERLAKAYTFRSDQFALTISTARTIMVNIFGESKITGGFTLSALNSAINALSAAGGPTEIGSVRTIQHIRGNNRTIIDLYAFMKDPTMQYKFDLQQNDIIFVPVVQNLVSIEGAVKRAMRYELLAKENLNDLIQYAGGLNVDAYPDFVQIQRYINGEIRLQEYNLNEVLNGKLNVPLVNGDIIRIKSIQKPIEQYVEISGSVFYPGNYDFLANPSLAKLLANAQPNSNAKTDLILIERIQTDETVEVLTIPWEDMKGSGKDFTLMARDRIRVPNQSTYRDVATISVNGHVRAPYEQTFALNYRLTVKQAIELAGGLKTSAYPVAYIFRQDLFNPGRTEYIRIRLEDSDNLVLKPGDRLNVYDNSIYSNIGEVRIFGAVKQPQEFTFDPSLTISDMITAAGGFNIGAALNRIEVFRAILSPTEQTRLELITLEIDNNYQVIKPANFNLQPYDQVVVRLTPAFTLGRTVEIAGEVNYPGLYVLESEQVQMSELINRAGGLLGAADARGSRLFRTYNNRGNIIMDIEKALIYHGNLKQDPILFEGDVINIERRENTVSIRPIGTRLADNTFNEAAVSFNLVFQGEKSARWYINNYAGGFVDRADKKSVTVSLKNGRVKSTKKSLLLFRNYPEVETGSLISLKMKPPKEKRESTREKTKWSEVWGTTLTAVTTALTIFVLAKQL
ncbi:MAG: SLBB domain-containing protein [Bacteroidetes bacterium]|nr:SLBB domain-containing protein [Bacteroidota bacterium]